MTLPVSSSVATPAPTTTPNVNDAPAQPPVDDSRRIDWLRSMPFFALHLGCLAVIWVGWSWPAVAVAVLLYAVRVFALTAFYHRYFSHRAFKTSRWFQCVGAILGLAAIQRGPLWWAAHHRKHHRHSDDPEDLHSPYHGGFWWSHIGWFLTKEHFKKNLHEIKDFTKYPELRFLDHYEMLVPVTMGIGLYLLGEGLAMWKPEWGCTGLQMFVWGFLISTVAVYHVTYTINSLCHLLGRRRYQTRDQSRNNLVLALLTFGEGWHNNHHRYPSSARQGFFWWEIDITYYTLVVLSWFGLVWDLRPVPQHVLTEHQQREAQSQQASA